MNSSDNMDAVFQALAHADRRRILDVVQSMPGCSVNDVCKYFETSRIAVMKHLKVLEQAGLLVSQKVGRTKELYFNVVPIQLIYDRWTTEYSSFWASQVTDLKFKLEGKTRRKNRGAEKEKPAARTRKRSATAKQRKQP